MAPPTTPAVQNKCDPSVIDPTSIADAIVKEIADKSKSDLNGDGRVDDKDGVLRQSLRDQSFKNARENLPKACEKLGRPLSRNVAVALSLPGPNFFATFSPQARGAAEAIFMKIMDDPEAAQAYFTPAVVTVRIPPAVRGAPVATVRSAPAATGAQATIPAGATSIVTLKNGAQEPEQVVTATMLSLKGLMRSGVEGILAVYELCEKCHDSSHVFSRTTGETLKRYSLVDASGRIHDSVRHVVLSAVVGEGLELHLESPIR